MQLTFTEPVYLWYLVTIPIIIAAHFYFLRYAKHRGLQFANFEALERLSSETVLAKNYTLLTLRVATITCFILAMSGATLWYQGSTSNTDFVFAIDTSASMTSEDLDPSRLGVAKRITSDTITKLEENRIQTGLGLISFSGSTYIESRVTRNYDEITPKINALEVREEGGTDLSGAIITGINLLADSEGKAIILLSDGGATTRPESQGMQNALDYAKSEKVTVHTVGLGTDEGPVGFLPEYYNASGAFSKETLLNVANATGGEYRRVRGDPSDVGSIIEETSEQALVDMDLASILLPTGVLLLFLEWGLASTRYRKLP